MHKNSTSSMNNSEYNAKKNMLEYGNFWKFIVLGILWITHPLIIYVAKEMSVWNYSISWVYNQ